MNRIVNTNIRLNLGKEDDRRAWGHLQKLDRTKYKSYSRAVIAALNDFFDRQERLADDPYLETREKEDAFLKRVLDTIDRSLRSDPPSPQTVPDEQTPDSAEPDSVKPDSTEQATMENTLMDFIESF